MIFLQIKKHEQIFFKYLSPDELKYWREELPKTFENQTKHFIIKWFLSMTHYPVKIQ